MFVKDYSLITVKTQVFVEIDSLRILLVHGHFVYPHSD